MRFFGIFLSTITNRTLRLRSGQGSEIENTPSHYCRLFKLPIAFYLLPVALCLLAQQSQAQLTVSLEAEGGVGWWIAHHEQPGMEDKSLLNFQFSAGLRLGYMIRPDWEVGLVANRDNILGYYLRNAWLIWNNLAGPVQSLSHGSRYCIRVFLGK